MTPELKQRIEEAQEILRGAKNILAALDKPESGKQIMEVSSLIKDLVEREEKLIAGIKRCMTSLATEAPDTIFMNGDPMTSPTMWEFMHDLIDFEAEKQQEMIYKPRKVPDGECIVCYGWKMGCNTTGVEMKCGGCGKVFQVEDLTTREKIIDK